MTPPRRVGRRWVRSRLDRCGRFLLTTSRSDRRSRGCHPDRKGAPHDRLPHDARARGALVVRLRAAGRVPAGDGAAMRTPDDGSDGLDVPRRGVAEAPLRLWPGGHLMMETCDRQAGQAGGVVAAGGTDPALSVSRGGTPPCSAAPVVPRRPAPRTRAPVARAGDDDAGTRERPGRVDDSGTARKWVLR